jgi:hypothetical protein
MPGADFRAPVAYAHDALDAWESSAAGAARRPDDQEALSDGNVTALWTAARLHTDDVGEQAWLVAHCVMARKSPQWLEAAFHRQRYDDYDELGQCRLPGRPIGEPADEP